MENKYDNVTIIGDCEIGENNIIYPGTIIINSKIGSGNEIINSTIKDSKIGDNNDIGPFCYIRNNSVIKNKTRIGASVEIKNSVICDRSKVAHLSYIGDATIETNVNVGAGVITANYDGKNKYKTHISKNAFIGSNSVLIAPINVGENAVIAAGSTLTTDVQTDSLAIARARQINKENYYKTDKI